MIQHIPKNVSPEHRAIVGFEWEIIERWLQAAPGRRVWFDGYWWHAEDPRRRFETARHTVPLLAGKLADDLAKGGER